MSFYKTQQSNSCVHKHYDLVVCKKAIGLGFLTNKFYKNLTNELYEI